jgi:hypothetical protein
MRFTAVLLALSLVVLVPVVAAGGPPNVSCDTDDDLYQHCNVGEVNVVYGPGCAGARLGATAECRPLL